MFSDIKAKTRTVKRDSGKGDQELSLKEIKHTEKMLLSKLSSCLAAPFTKPQVRESMQFLVKLKMLLMVFAFKHTNKTTKQLETKQHSHF